MAAWKLAGKGGCGGKGGYGSKGSYPVGQWPGRISAAQPAARSTDAAARSLLKCATPGCRFRVHSRQELGAFCCIACSEGGPHGPRCEQALAPAGARQADMRLARMTGAELEDQELQEALQASISESTPKEPDAPAKVSGKTQEELELEEAIRLSLAGDGGPDSDEIAEDEAGEAVTSDDDDLVDVRRIPAPSCDTGARPLPVSSTKPSTEGPRLQELEQQVLLMEAKAEEAVQASLAATDRHAHPAAGLTRAAASARARTEEDASARSVGRTDAGKVTAQFQLGKMYKALGKMLVRTKEELSSSEITRFDAGSQVEILRAGVGETGKRVYVRGPGGTEGWVSVVSGDGELLLEIVDQHAPMMSGEEVLREARQVHGLNEEELDAVIRLERLGFRLSQALEAYLVCDKNQDVAANYLMTGGL